MKTKERKFLINNEDRTYTMEEMEEANSDSPEVVREINTLSPNESTVFGGGAQPTIKITRII